MKLFSGNFHTILRLVINQIAIALFSLMMSVFYMLIDHWAIMLLVGIFCTVFYLWLQYTVLWMDGAKDRIRVDGGRATRVKLKGLWLGLYAGILNFVLGILAVIGNLAPQGSWLVNFKICHIFVRLLEAMYVPFIQLFSPYNPIAYILIAIPAVLVCCAAYELGYRNIRIGSFFGIKGKKQV